jgi:hypothetical protein
VDWSNRERNRKPKTNAYQLLTQMTFKALISLGTVFILKKIINDS